MAESGASAWWSKYGILVSILSCYIHQISEAITLQPSMAIGQHLGVTDTLQSEGGFFELGFFTPDPNSTNRYLGIWFMKAKTTAVVWVSNREKAFTSASPVLTFQEDGNLATLDGKTTYKVTNATINDTKNTRVVLVDSGNLVLQDKRSNVLWESFDYPTDTLLAGMKLGYDHTIGKTWAIRSWKSPTDPSIGPISMMLDSSGSGWTYVFRTINQVYLAFGTFWVGNYLNDTWSINVANNQITYNYSMPTKDYATLVYEINGNQTDLFVKYQTGDTGQLKVLMWQTGYPDWIKLFSLPNRECDFYGYCGKFTICDQQSSENPCYCLPGYKHASTEDWENQNYMDGCEKALDVKCSDDNKYQYYEVPHVTLPAISDITFGYAREEDCRSTCTRNCSCKGYSFRFSRCALFFRDITNVQRLPDQATNTETIYVKTIASDSDPKDNDPHILTGWKLWITVITTLSAAIISSVLFIYHFWKDRLSQVEGKDLLSYNFQETAPEELLPGEGHGRVITGYQIPLFKYSSVCSTTDDFSAMNKLGKGGFGAVYKGKLHSGEQIAVKRLSKLIPGKGSKEVKTEALLIAELRHNNLVRLLGCCLEGNENIIIYEYFPLRSLDLYLYDPNTTIKLGWENRTRIIYGIAAGLNYLHEYSRLQIIHGDLKASNILLDENMNPKITDFAMTRIYGAKETLATNRMFGTFGYMSPEYASKGIVSNKSDVFSFGVLVLEILSGKKNNFRNASSLNLLGYVWDLWNNNKPLDLMDPNRGESSTKMKRYIEVALLCVQENDNERPAMSDVIMYLENDTMDLPVPKEPAFSKARALF